MKNTINSKLRAQMKAANLKGNVHASIIELAMYGNTCTGKSGYSKGWASKSVWTAEVCKAAAALGIAYNSGNDAPRGGASGEFVCLVSDKRKNRTLHQFQAIVSRARRIRLIRFKRETEISRARLIETEQRIQREAANLIPFAVKFQDEFKAARYLTGQAKSDAQKNVFVKVLQAAGNPDINGIFWPVFRNLNGIII